MATCSDRADSEVSFTGAIAFSLEKLGLPDVSLKAEQRSAIKAMYEGRDVFVCLPTGYLCYQTLPFVMDHKDNRTQASAVVVVSPLIALMEEQVQPLNS